PLNVTVHIDPDAAMVDLDLRDNIDNLDCGLNESEACVGASTFAGVFNSIDPTVPRNSGSFRRVRLHLRDGCVAGRPKFPHSCSVATTNVADRLINIVQSAVAEIGEGFGLAEGGIGMGAYAAVISGHDHRHGDEAYVNQLVAGSSGGPASPVADGWVTYGIPVVAGLMYRDSIEVDELKHPMEFHYLRLADGTGGAGRFRGAPGMEISYGPKESPMDVIWPTDGTINVPKGVRGGRDGAGCLHFKVGANGHAEELGGLAILRLAKGEVVTGRACGGGGYGSPLEREPRRVLRDVLEHYETPERARDIYGVVLTGAVEDESLAVDMAATRARRAELTAAG
ncbi:MAG: hydantoinase B/oxoprolinase family protein, partial [Sneathiellaceae bacterium]